MKIIWTNQSLLLLKEIFDYYNKRVSKRLAYKIVNEISERLEMLIVFPEAGKIEKELSGLHKYRSIILGNYKIIYSVRKDIYIHLVFGFRRNPKNLEL